MKRIIIKRYMRQPIEEGGRWRDVYWLDKPVRGLIYFHGDDLERLKD